jgi:hypothetical protein
VLNKNEMPINPSFIQHAVVQLNSPGHNQVSVMKRAKITSPSPKRERENFLSNHELLM